MAESEQIGKTKLYFAQYLPGSIIQLRRNNSFAKVVSTHSNEREKDKISRVQLLEVTQHFIQHWDSFSDGSVDLGLIQAIEHDEIIISSPHVIYVKPYPYILRCNNFNTCGRLMNIRGYSENILKENLTKLAKKTYQYIQCPEPGCNGHMVQLGLASIHRCGSLHEVNLGYQVPERAAIKHINDSAYKTNLIDLATGKSIRELYQPKCTSCQNQYPELANDSNRLYKASAGDVFYSQNIQYIALNDHNSQLIHRLINNASIQDDVVSGLLLSLIEQLDIEVRVEQFESLLSGSNLDPNEIEQINQELINTRNQIEAMPQSGLPEDVIEGILKTLREKERECLEKLRCASGVFPDAKKYISDVSRIRGLCDSRRNFEAALIYADINTYGFKELIKDIADPYERNIEISKLEKLKNDYGVYDIRHVNDLSVVLASVGFTREKVRPDNEEGTIPVQLNGYREEGGASSRSDYHLYAMQASTEALIIKLSAIRILKWCVKNFQINIEDPSFLEDESKAHAYLLETYEVLMMEPKHILSYSAEHGLHETAPFHLIHSIAHALISTAKQHSGYEENNLVEYLLPSNLGFIMYVSSVKNYTAGGLSNLFKYYLTNWFDDASLHAFNCMMDPVCSEEGASCSSCLQQAINCELFNLGLSRSYMHGGIVEKDVLSLQHGYWTQSDE